MSMQSSAFVASGVPVLNVGCVQQGFIDISKCNYLPEAVSSDFTRYQLKCDDILLTRSGSIGRAATVPASLDGALMTFHLIRIRTEQNRCLPKYLQYALLGAKSARKQLEGSAIGATRAGLNTRLVADMWVPLAPPAEQHKIVEALDLAFARLNKLTATRLLLQKQIGLLDSTVLAKAFRGELVPQDPNDEPASVLLERIRAEREAHASSAPKRSRGRNSAA
jgi:type I restriction enzyme S subunit